MADLGSTRVYGDLTVTRSLTVAGKNVEDSLDERALLTDARFTDAREWTASEVTQAEAEAGTATTSRKWTAQRVRQAIAAWWAGSAEKTKLDGIQAGAQVNVATNLSVTGTGNTRTIASSTGTNANITFTAADVGALPLAGGTMTGAITFAAGQTWPTFNQSTTGNAATATRLQTARTINGVSFNGTANITVADATKLPLAGGTMTGAITFAAGQTWPTFNQDTTGNAATATKLATARTINGVGFDGSANITVEDATKLPLAGGTMTGAITFAAGQTWPTFNQDTTGNAGSATALANARTLTIGSTGKSFNGTSNVSWTLAEIGAAAESHAHDYLPLAGGTVSGDLIVSSTTASTSPTTGALKIAGGVGVGGALYAQDDVGITSDRRLKTDIEVIENALATVKKMRGVKFTRIKSGARQTGLIAQEVKAAIPEAVTGDEKEGYLSVAYGNLVGLLVEAVKELSSKVEALENRGIA